MLIQWSICIVCSHELLKDRHHIQRKVFISRDTIAKRSMRIIHVKLGIRWVHIVGGQQGSRQVCQLFTMDTKNWRAMANNRVVHLDPHGCECERRIILHDVLVKVVALSCLQYEEISKRKGWHVKRRERNLPMCTAHLKFRPTFA